MKRTPINLKEYDVIVTQEGVTFKDLIPKIRYEFYPKRPVPDEATNMYHSLLDFMETNQSLVLTGNTSWEFVEGFSQSLALVRFWIESLYVEENNPA